MCVLRGLLVVPACESVARTRCGEKTARRGLRADRSVTVNLRRMDINTYTGRQVRGRGGGGVSAARATADCRVPRKNPTARGFRLSRGRFAPFERRSGRVCTGSSICILVVSVHVSRGDTVIRAASRSRLSAYRDFDFYDDDCLCAGSCIVPRPRPARAALAARNPRSRRVRGRSRESSTGKISRVLHEDMFHMTQHHHMLLKPTRDVREGKAWAGMAKTPLQFPAQHQ